MSSQPDFYVPRKGAWPPKQPPLEAPPQLPPGPAVQPIVIHVHQTPPPTPPTTGTSVTRRPWLMSWGGLGWFLAWGAIIAGVIYGVTQLLDFDFLQGWL